MTTRRRKATAKKAVKKPVKKTATSTAAARKPAAAGSPAPRKGERVSWNFGKGSAVGRVIETFREKVTRRFKGSAVTRNATPDAPAVMVETDRGDRALKSAGELRPARTKRKSP